jgi:manganese/iron transport system permease protein
MSLHELLIDPMTYSFMQRALIAAVMVGIISGVIGSFVVVRSMSFFGDALAHTILPGVAAAYILTGSGAPLPLFLGGLTAGVGAALGIGWLTRDGRLKEDSAIGIVFVAMFALGIAIISSDPRAYGRDLVHILFGNILGIRDMDIYIMLACGLVVVGVIILLYKELLLVSFDQGLARTLKLPSEALRLLLLVLIAVTIVASLQIVGIALMLAMLVTPAATAQLVTRRMHHMMMAASSLGVLSGVVGVYVSYHLAIATGPAIVLTITAIFALTFAITQIRARLAART